MPPLPPRLLSLLRTLGPHLYHSVPTLTRLVRVLAGMVGAPQPGGAMQAARPGSVAWAGGVAPGGALPSAPREMALELLTANVMPALTLVPSNAGGWWGGAERWAG